MNEQPLTVTILAIYHRNEIAKLREIRRVLFDMGVEHKFLSLLLSEVLLEGRTEETADPRRDP